MHFPPSQSIVIAITLMFNCNNWLCFASIPFHKSTSIFAGLCANNTILMSGLKVLIKYRLFFSSST